MHSECAAAVETYVAGAVTGGIKAGLATCTGDYISYQMLSVHVDMLGRVINNQCELGLEMPGDPCMDSVETLSAIEKVCPKSCSNDKSDDNGGALRMCRKGEEGPS